MRYASIGTGIAVDKLLALTGQMPSLQIANVVLPSAERQAIHDKLDAIAHRFRESSNPSA